MLRLLVERLVRGDHDCLAASVVLRPPGTPEHLHAGDRDNSKGRNGKGREGRWATRMYARVSLRYVLQASLQPTTASHLPIPTSISMSISTYPHLLTPMNLPQNASSSSTAKYHCTRKPSPRALSRSRRPCLEHVEHAEVLQAPFLGVVHLGALDDHRVGREVHPPRQGSRAH